MSLRDKVFNFIGYEPIKAENKDSKSLSSRISKNSFERTKQDVLSWRNAIKRAENIYNPSRSDMQKMYLDTRLNAVVTACLSKRKNLILLKKINWINEKNEIVEFDKDFTNAVWFEKLLNYILDAQFYGYSLVFLGDIKDGQFEGMELIKRQNVTVDYKEVLSMPSMFRGTSFEEEPYKDFHLYVDTSSDSGISKCGYGLLYYVAVYEIICRNLLGYNADFVELFAQPMRIGKTNKSEGAGREEFYQMLKDVGNNAFALIDEEESIEFVESKNSSNGFLGYDNLEKRCEEKIKQVLLGHSGILDSQAGKLGSNDEIKEAIKELEMVQCSFVLPFLNTQLLPKMRNLGFDIPLNIKLQFSNDKEKEEQKEEEVEFNQSVSNYVKTFADAGIEVDLAQLEEKTGLKLTKKVEQLGGAGVGKLKIDTSNRWYLKNQNSCCTKIYNASPEDIAWQNESWLIIDRAIKKVFENVKIKSLPKLEAFYKKVLGQAVDSGMKGYDFEELRLKFFENITAFSGQKSDAMLQELNDLKVLSKGDFEVFTKLSKKANVSMTQYLRTEYETANATSKSSAEWSLNRDKFEYVRWLQIDRATAREDHKPLDNRIFKTKDLPFLPPIGFNCGCELEYIDSDEKVDADKSTPGAIMQESNPKEWERMQKYGFDKNSALTGEIFNLDLLYNE